MARKLDYTIVRDLEHLRKLTGEGHTHYALLLGSGAISKKTIRRQAETYRITNHIDDTKQTLSEGELWTQSNIGKWLDGGALVAL